MTRILILSLSLLLCLSTEAQEIRSLSGIGNNISNPEWGATGSRMSQMVSNGFADLIDQPSGADRANPRIISNTLFSQSSDINDQLSLSDYVWVFGQFIDHDITLVENSVTEPMMIPVPADDAIFDPFGTGQVVIPMFRSYSDPTSGTSPENPRVFLNEITSFIDGSTIYGSDHFRANWLRSFKNGKLKTSDKNLLPFNTITGEFNDQIDPTAPFMADDLHSGKKLFVAGDIRANENLLLLSFHTLFMREHNRVCDEIRKRNPSLSDENLYQKAKAKVIGQIQSIVYDEWLPAMGVHLNEFQGYQKDVNPAIFNVFSAAAFRLGHTLLSPTIKRMAKDGSSIPLGDISLRNAYFNPLEILRAGGLDPYFKGMGTQIEQDLDCKVIDDVRNFLFGAPGAGGLDLAAINIMRGRERGLPDFNTIKENLGLERALTFSEICSGEEVKLTLEELYSSVDDVDPWVGMLAEDHMPDALFGQTIMRIMERQFSNLRDGDRFFYEIDPSLNEEDIAEIKSTNFSDIIRRNTDIKLMQDNVFFAMDHENIPFANVTVLPVQLDAVTFPNPAVDVLHFKIYIRSEGQLTFDIVDLSGQVVQSESRDAFEGENTFSLDLNQSFLPGLYYVQLNIGEDSKTIKFIKH